MRYETVRPLKDEDFKRSKGVQRNSFEKMLEVVEKGMRDFGRPPKLNRADQLLMTLMYWRKYRTGFHIGLAYDVSESAVFRTIQKVEDVLIKSKQFHLPGIKKCCIPAIPRLKPYCWIPPNSRLSVQKKDTANISAVKRDITRKKHR